MISSCDNSGAARPTERIQPMNESGNWILYLRT